MKVCYYSDELDEFFESEEECKAAEAKAAKNSEAVKKQRNEEVQQAYRDYVELVKVNTQKRAELKAAEKESLKHAIELEDEYLNDYQEIEIVLHDSEGPMDAISRVMNEPFLKYLFKMFN